MKSSIGRGTGFSTWVNIGLAITVLYFGGCIVAWYKGGPGHFLTIPDTMSLEAFSSVLTGVAAPLAFLWLFVATMVQSQELALQRHQIEQNRQVAEGQAASAERTADFIGTQTELLQQQMRLHQLEQADGAQSVRQFNVIEFCRKHFPTFPPMPSRAFPFGGIGHELSEDNDIGLQMLCGRIREYDESIGLVWDDLPKGGPVDVRRVHELDRRLVDLCSVASTVSPSRMAFLDECELVETLAAVRSVLARYDVPVTQPVQ
ncbi:hypothetical protein LGH82_02845 [Mesorhizobium sp. PAMC28654]|uniref:hypothetical protein n=1 Tax=Mesorhizobium sp. PAMC28654 TaxID=2880934 RepID=UPI001D0B4842|nr:hypothetical protein [Mesorhizobium sp. PAMC28654]UDL90339.1 hypothetical protein LGH82_02845 [Mesorhizobium sp. PAMC28654]